jgi:hypothetical protein
LPDAAELQVGRADGVVVMIVQPGERNVFDQQWIQARSVRSAAAQFCSL